MKRSGLLAGLVLAWLSLGAQASGMASAEEGHAARGIFLGYDEAEHRVTIAHEAVPDVMMAMRMHLALPDGEPTPDFSVGDKVAFQMFSRVENGRSWYAKELEALPADTELELPEELRDKIGH
ncbi:MAG: copper-binding protein [Pseudomonadota bacterium]